MLDLSNNSTARLMRGLAQGSIAGIDATTIENPHHSSLVLRLEVDDEIMRVVPPHALAHLL